VISLGIVAFPLPPSVVGFRHSLHHLHQRDASLPPVY
jgi:hypothetical protein